MPHSVALEYAGTAANLPTSRYPRKWKCTTPALCWPWLTSRLRVSTRSASPWLVPRAILSPRHDCTADGGSLLVYKVIIIYISRNTLQSLWAPRMRMQFAQAPMEIEILWKMTLKILQWLKNDISNKWCYMRLCVAMNCCSDLNTVYFYSWADKSKLRTCTKEVGNALHSHLTSITNDLKHCTSQGKVVQSASGNENSYSALLEKQNSRQDNIHMGHAPKNGLANCLHKSCLINSLFHPPWYWPLPSQPFLVFDDVNLVTHCFQDVLNDLSKLQRSNRIHILPIW